MPRAMLTLPVEVRLRKMKATWTLKESNGQAFLLREMYDPEPERKDVLDGWTIRDRFLRLRSNESDLLKFLTWVGRFTPVVLGFSEEYDVSVIWRWQDIFRQVLLRRAVDWKEDFFRDTLRLKGLEWEKFRRAVPHPHLFNEARVSPPTMVPPQAEIQFLLIQEKPTVVVHTTCGLYAIGSTVEIDLVRGAEFKWCARPDCPTKIFEPTSRHQTKYCSYDCAHLQSIRNKRGTIVVSETGEPTKAQGGCHVHLQAVSEVLVSLLL
jgi:hypothetical protein